MPLSALLGEPAELITAELPSAVKRIIILANGELVEPGTQVDPQAPRIYSTPPHQVAIECILNRALGTPGATIAVMAEDEEVTYRQAIDPVSNKDYTDMVGICEQMFRDAVPMALERLMELASGITIQNISQGKQTTITRIPSARAIEYIANRVAGTSTSVLGAIAESQDEAEKDELETEYFDLSGDPKSETSKLRSDNAAGLPAYMTEANLKLATFLPTAIKNMTVLSRGATTTIEIDNESTVIQHDPELRANVFLVNRFMGAPTNYVQVLPLAEQAVQKARIEKLLADNTDIIARYGGIDALLAAYRPAE